MVPIAILAISDLMLPAYDNIPVMLATYAIMTLPVCFGRLQRREQPRWLAVSQWGLFAILPATLFYIVSNFAVWAFQSDYEKSLVGLGALLLGGGAVLSLDARRRYFLLGRAARLPGDCRRTELSNARARRWKSPSRCESARLSAVAQVTAPHGWQLERLRSPSPYRRRAFRRPERPC